MFGGFGGGEGCAYGGLDLGEEIGGGGRCVCRGMRGWLTLGGGGRMKVRARKFQVVYASGTVRGARLQSRGRCQL